MTAAWARGADLVRALLDESRLQQVGGAAADGTPLLARARRTLRTAATLVGSDDDSALVLAYDAARQAGSALLAHQGLRATQRGGHYAVEQVLRAQFGSGFRPFGDLRRRRHEIEYPAVTGDDVSSAEAREAVDTAAAIVASAAALLPSLGIWG